MSVQITSSFSVEKGVFPYDYVKNMDVLNKIFLLTHEPFYNQFTESECSPTKYVHAQNMWNTFIIQKLKEYTDLYLFTDKWQLSDVFDSYRETCISEY